MCRVSPEWDEASAIRCLWSRYVITSYSIHYTKLYENRCGAICPVPIRTCYRSCKHRSNLRCPPGCINRRPRITSYNVCYTKLLRFSRCFGGCFAFGGHRSGSSSGFGSCIGFALGNFSGHGRITSYNVCYTKLLRVPVCRHHHLLFRYAGGGLGKRSRNGLLSPCRTQPNTDIC